MTAPRSIKRTLRELLDQGRVSNRSLKSSFCGRFSGCWDDVSSDAGAVWSIIKNAIRELHKSR